jgi:hypothetical protein
MELQSHSDFNMSVGPVALTGQFFNSLQATLRA